MKRTFIQTILIIAPLLLSQLVLANAFEEPFNPFKDRKISVLKIVEMSRVIRTCKIRHDERTDYWPLTNDFVNLVDDQVNKKLAELKYKPSNKRATHKQYLGIQTENNVNLVYVFIYPQPSRVIDKEAGNPVLLCRKSDDNLIFEFDKNKFTFTLVTLE